jgi:DNA-binding NarL/FixJ family response regulator
VVFHLAARAATLPVSLKTVLIARLKTFQNYAKYAKHPGATFLSTTRKAALSVNGNTQSGVICDSHPMWLDAVEQVLRRIAIHVVGKATSTSEALSMVEEHSPDLLITELESLPGNLSGLALIERARVAQPSVRSIVLSMHTDSQVIDAALAAGASAYVVKTAHPEDLASAVRQAFSHSVYLAGRRAPEPAVAAEKPKVDDSPGLTRRELEILRLVAEGHSNAQLARMLWVTEQTVKFHLSNIYRKLDVANRTEASRWAQRNGLLQDAPTLALAAIG